MDLQVKLLGIKLKKLVLKGLRLGALLILVMSILSTNLGTSVILVSPGDRSFSGESSFKLYHLQLFGGLIHIHNAQDQECDSSQSKMGTEKLTGEKLPFVSKKFQILGTLKYLTGQPFVEDGSDSRLFSVSIATKYLEAGENLLLSALVLSRKHIQNQRPLSDPFLAVPHPPPVI